MKLSVVIPVFNEEKFVGKTLKKVVKANSLGLKKEIIIVDDGSTDQSRLVIKKAVKQIKENNESITFIEIFLPNNQGKGNALKKGFSQSTGDIVLTQDADWEYDPKDYFLLLKPILAKQTDVVYGSRFLSNSKHKIDNWQYIINYIISSLSNFFTGFNLTDIETGFKVFSGDLIRQLAPILQSRGFDFEPEITSRLSKLKNIKISEVSISYLPRNYQQGKKISWRDGIITLFSIFKYKFL
jgi:glycosyltransferase involved in cell wall biosynthesis